MRRIMRMAVLAGALLAMNGLVPPAGAVGEVTGRFVEETAPAVYGTVTDPTSGETVEVLVSPPVYAPLRGRVEAYAPDATGAPRRVASDATDADGNFSIAGLTENVFLKVVPSSPDWQPGWLWVEYMDTRPGFASWVQLSPPTIYDVAPGTDVGMLKTLTAVASGRVVDLASGLGIARAKVSYGPPVESGGTFRTATTNAKGYFKLTGLTGDEFAVTVTARGYVGGYVGCDRLVHPTWGEACSHGGGDIGVISLVRP